MAVTVTLTPRPAVTVASTGVQGPQGDAGAGIPASVVFVESAADFPDAVDGVRTLADNVTYFITATVDLAGDRLVGGANTTIIGGSSENCILKSTGLSGTALLTTAETTPIRNIAITADIGVAIDGGGTAALDWFGVNFVDCGVCGTIANVANFIATDCALLNSGALTFDGTIGTVGLSANIISPAAGQTGIIIAATATITRRFRIIYSAVVAWGTITGLNVSTSATIPTEGYILDTVSFGGGGTYTAGVTSADSRAKWLNCTGVINTISVANMYMTAGASTGAVTANAWVAVPGTTALGPYVQRFTHSDATNSLCYTSSVTRRFVMTCTFSLTSSNNNVIEFALAVFRCDESQVPASDVLSETTMSVVASGSRPDAGTVQGVVELAEGDAVYLVARNTGATNQITVSYLNLIIQQAVS
jgi:hypothetical protein